MSRGFCEWPIYRFGLNVGFSNLLRNGFALGIPKTIGKITQPINVHSRFPEYALMGAEIDAFARSTGIGNPRVLDIGSPKLFGLRLAFSRSVDVILTDIRTSEVREAEGLWQCIKNQAQGSASFSTSDARRLPFRDCEFDIVYAMSVVEHIEGLDGVETAIQEMCRVLRTGGLLLISVPFGSRYAVQSIDSAAAFHTDRQGAGLPQVFFQRIYDYPILRRDILGGVGKDARVRFVVRRGVGILRCFHLLPTAVRGLLGFLNPVLSQLCNAETGEGGPCPSRYGDRHSPRDIYGDAVILGVKRGSSEASADQQ